ILIGTSYKLMVTSDVFLGIAYGGLFPLSLIFLSLCAINALEAAKLSGMAQAVGYLLAATGSILRGYLLDLIGMWNAYIYNLIDITIFTVLIGLGAGRDRVVSK